MSIFDLEIVLITFSDLSGLIAIIEFAFIIFIVIPIAEDALMALDEAIFADSISHKSSLEENGLL